MSILARTWSPARELAAMRNSMERIFGEPYAGFDSAENDAEGAWMPAVDILAGDGELRLRAELPGLNEDEVEITLDNNTLSIKGEKKLDSREEKGGYRRIESRYGSFYRSFHLPSSVDRGRIQAEFKNGVLEIVLPKAESAKPKRIPVSLG